MLDETDTMNANLLIVDDQEADIAQLGQLLGSAGYARVSSTTNAKEVCALFRGNRYDLIVIALQMSGMDGFQVIESLKAQHAQDSLPILVIAGRPDDELRALQAGARDFIRKPFNPVEVGVRVRNVLEVQLLYRKLAALNAALALALAERTAELGASEAGYRSLTELASDWYWEQDENGNFTKLFGPVLEVLGIGAQGHAEQGLRPGGWNEAERRALQAGIAARQPLLDLLLSRVNADGSTQQFQVSGQPIFDLSCRCVGYRGIGVEVTELLSDVRARHETDPFRG